jgi:hypothetical protein
MSAQYALRHLSNVSTSPLYVVYALSGLILFSRKKKSVESYLNSG